MSQKWGQATWLFLHSFSCKVKEEHFDSVKNEMIKIFKEICNVLPCPYCQEHARHFIATNDFSKIKTKLDYIIMIWSFHNIVNKRTGKKIYNFDNINIYNKSFLRNIIIYFENNFMRPINNQRLLMDSLGRSLVIKHVKTFIYTNKDKFNL
jgi:hypothetical protein